MIEGNIILKTTFLFLLTALITNAQTSYYEPATPVFNKSLKIVYNPFSGTAKFAINDDVYILINEIDQEGERSESWQKMMREKSVFVSSIELSAKSAFLQIYFITLSENSWDVEANLRISVFNESGLEVMNARHHDFDEEIKNYPGNFAVYRNKFFLVKFQRPGTYRSIIIEDLNKILQVKEISAGLLLSQSYAYLLIGERKKSFDIIERMVKLSPDKAYTFDAVGLFVTELFSNSNDRTMYNEIRTLAESLVLKKSSSPYAWNLVEAFSTSIFSDSCISVVCRDWIKNQSDNPSPYYLLSLILSRQGLNNYSYRKILLDKFIDLTLHGRLRLYGDVGGKTNLFKLSFGYYLLSEVYLAENNLEQALSAIHTAIGLNKEPNDKMFITSGDIWFKLSNYKLAEESYFKAWASGNKDAKDKILQCYSITHNDTSGFGSYFSEKTKTDFSESSGE